MSKITLTPHASGTGTLNIAAPNTNSTRTLTLPDETGTVLTSGAALPAIDGAALTNLTSANLTGALPAIDGSALTGLPAGGKVLQVVSALLSTQVTHSTATLVDFGLSLSITPSSISSKILLLFHSAVWSSGGSYSLCTILRDATNLGGSNGFGEVGNNTGNGYNTYSIVHSDAPSTTSAITYKIQIATGNTSGSFGRSGSPSTLVAMEIAV